MTPERFAVVMKATLDDTGNTPNHVEVAGGSVVAHILPALSLSAELSRATEASRRIVVDAQRIAMLANDAAAIGLAEHVIRHALSEH